MTKASIEEYVVQLFTHYKKKIVRSRNSDKTMVAHLVH
jgi:hypothetical protein